MALHSSMSPVAIFKRRNRDQSSGAPLPLRTLLGNEVRTAYCLYRGGKESGNQGMVERGRNRFLDAREQLRLLDAIEYGYIKPVPMISDYVFALLEGGQS